MPNEPAVIELRRYTLHSGQRDALIERFERDFIDPQEAAGMSLDGTFRQRGDPNRFVWIRSFPNMGLRERALREFYEGSVWQTHRDAANATMADSDDVLLLQGTPPPADLVVKTQLFCAIYLCKTNDELQERLHHFTIDTIPMLESWGATTISTWSTLDVENTYPALPVRDVYALVALIDAADPMKVRETMPTELVELIPTSRSRIQRALHAAPGDFAFLDGAWNVRHRILKRRLEACDEWEIIDDVARAHVLLDGLISVDEIGIGTRGKGSSFRHLDLERKTWSIYWVNSATGALFAPVYGGFSGDRCELYGYDREGDVEVYVRYRWRECETDHPLWDQAFSTDGGTTWETNWVMEFRR